MKKIEIWVATNKVGSRSSNIIEVEDDLTEDEITEMAFDEIWNMLEWDWQEIDG